ncbi:hypothetical protein NX801_01830 [Streptomyces sp. LP05-1]|uniref:HEAT repeat domain-containing protein n=1 Tax=Streptomyces pyxinae TaxID=2970734 RepID=A0ABT2CAL0_9ACTN|nr:hypothetical protein [Streptomyces sp. LP05-1]MCS0634424.1 hypothetical protein [Streptomyces sp. LP05-1]
MLANRPAITGGPFDLKLSRIAREDEAPSVRETAVTALARFRPRPTS